MSWRWLFPCGSRLESVAVASASGSCSEAADSISEQWSLAPKPGCWTCWICLTARSPAAIAKLADRFTAASRAERLFDSLTGEWTAECCCLRGC